MKKKSERRVTFCVLPTAPGDGPSPSCLSKDCPSYSVVHAKQIETNTNVPTVQSTAQQNGCLYTTNMDFFMVFLERKNIYSMNTYILRSIYNIYIYEYILATTRPAPPVWGESVVQRAIIAVDVMAIRSIFFAPPYPPTHPPLGSNGYVRLPLPLDVLLPSLLICAILQHRAVSVRAGTSGAGLSREEARLLIRAELKRAGISDKITRYSSGR